MLLQIAGLSSSEYKSFYSIYKSTIKVNAVRKLIGEILDEASNNRNIVNGELTPSELFRMQLKNKLEPDGVITKFLSKHLSGCPLQDIFLLQIDEKTFPNAFSYAVNDTPWEGHKILDMTCYAHGDLHGNNVFVSTKNSNYAIIDMASYREDGWLFYDTAYFEYSLMLHNMEKESLANWLYCIEQVANQSWDDIDFKDSKVIRAISEEEEKWIEKKITDKFNYLDKLKSMRLLARVLVGLNYSGKKNISDESRLKAYLFACCYLKYFLQAEGIRSMASTICTWKVDTEIDKDNHEYTRFLDFAGKFDNSQNYYLVLGKQWNYSDATSINLSKLRLSGIISFCLEKNFSDILQEKKLLRYIIPNNDSTWNDIEKNSTWWLWANGIKADPDSQAENFPKWRIKYREFWNQFTDKMIKSVGEDDLLFIIDGTALRNEDDKYIQYLLEQLDAIESVMINIAILQPEDESCKIDLQDYANLKIATFKINLENIAEYCNLYLPDTADDIIYIPHRLNRIGVPLDKKDQQYIEQYTILVHEHLIRRENILTESDKYNFYYGEPITWTAIEEELYVKHKKITLYEEKIRQKLKNANKDQILISIQHSPGAGATVLGRIICWNLKKEYPTIILQNKFDEDVYESLLRIASISGTHLLVFWMEITIRMMSTSLFIEWAA